MVGLNCWITDDSETALRTDLSCQAPDVPNKTGNSYKKTGPPRSTLHETLTVAFENQLGVREISIKGDPINRSLRGVLAQGSIL